MSSRSMTRWVHRASLKTGALEIVQKPWEFILILIFLFASDVQAQFRLTWLDIGELHSQYSEVGAHIERETQNQSLEWPAILRRSGHYRSKAYWIGVKEWTDEHGVDWDYRVTRRGFRTDGSVFYTPLETKLVSRFSDPQVIVDGVLSYSRIAIVDEIDPDLPADRMIYHRFRSILGIETERWVYAFAHDLHDDYHIIQRRMINNGNTDEDGQIELPGQTLNDVLFFNSFRWSGREMGGWHGSIAQIWGKFNMVDIVGDGNEEYPVDFTAVFSWQGWDPEFQTSQSVSWNHIGSPMLRELGWEAPGDTIGRLAGGSMQGRIVLHADEAPTDRNYNPANQPVTIGWVEPDEIDFGHFSPERDYYELGILTRENPVFVPGGSSRMYPHYADRIEPRGEFWNPTEDASIRKQGGQAAALAYGPYQMAFRDTIHIVEAEGVGGLSFEAGRDIGVAYKENGFDDAFRIPYDANGDGQINDSPWNYEIYDNGSELLTKNQWVFTARDSLFQFMYKARDVWEASNRMTRYPILEPPRPPRRFEVTSRPDRIELSWDRMEGSKEPAFWEIYRTTRYQDNLPYELIAELPGSVQRYDDLEVRKGVDYYYYIQAVGRPNPVDEKGITGTPYGSPLKSGRYYTLTHHPATLTRNPGEQVTDFRIVPNPVNFASDETIRSFRNNDPTQGQVEFLDIPGYCTISIFTETGELVKRIEHNNGSGNELWDLNTASNQPVVSGIYLVHVTDHDTGNVDIKKMVVVR